MYALTRTTSKKRKRAKSDSEYQGEGTSDLALREARAALRIARNLQHTLQPEIKRRPLPVAGNAAITLTAFNLSYQRQFDQNYASYEFFNNITQGDQWFQRTGDAVHIHSIHARGRIRSGATDCVLRIMIVKDTSPNDRGADSLANYDEILDSDTSDDLAVYAPYKSGMEDRFQILYDELFTCTQSTTGNNDGRVFNLNFEVDEPSHYHGSGASNQYPTMNAYYFCAYHSASSAQYGAAIYNLNLNCRFTDA
jgi:hypothetical protein